MAPRLLPLALVFHVVYVSSIFYIYFVSPVLSGIDQRFSAESVCSRPFPHAERVVVIVADGLRADKFYDEHDRDVLEGLSAPDGVSFRPLDEKNVAAPFLHSLVASNETRFGISHTRVPTESRPGHVALLAGMYEDVSAVTKGWQENPVDFDDVFNQSASSVLMGSPDIVNIFGNERMTKRVYGAAEENFSKDGALLDVWVLNELRAFLNATPPENAPSLFLLHLLGTDMTGHSYRPNGPEYLRSIRVVDHVVEQTVRLFSDHFDDDNATAFVFTADHGMGPRGSHGDGSPENTRTPLVAWGRGAAGSDQLADVAQADIAVLISALLGHPVPANSEGIVPLSYLDATEESKACMALANAQQALHALRIKTELKERHTLGFVPDQQFIGKPNHASTYAGKGVTSRMIDDRIRQIRQLISQGDYVAAQKQALSDTRDAFQAIKYIHKYHWLLLRSLVALAYLGFMAHSAVVLIQKGSFSLQYVSLSSSIALLAYSVLAARFYYERSPVVYYVYAFFPCFFVATVVPGVQQLRKEGFFVSLSLLHVSHLLLALLALQVIVYAYQRRYLFSVLLLLLGWVWPLFEAPGVSWKYWRASTTLLAVFPSLPAEKGESIPLIVASGVLSSIVTAVVLTQLTLSNFNRTLISTIGALELAITAVSGLSAYSLSTKQGLPLPLQMSGWLLLLLSISLIFIHGRPKKENLHERLAFLFLVFLPSFTILSLSYEILFYLILGLTLVSWIALEHSLHVKNPQAFSSIRISLFFLVFVHVSFFGVGNVASISSFYLEPVYRLIPVFDPFSMALLLLYKLLIPFVVLSLSMVSITRLLQKAPLSLFFTASTLSTFLALNFFFRVTDTGSWLEIGTSITNFVICSFLGIFDVVLFSVGGFLLGGVESTT